MRNEKFARHCLRSCCILCPFLFSLVWGFLWRNRRRYAQDGRLRTYFFLLLLALFGMFCNRSKTERSASSCACRKRAPCRTHVAGAQAALEDCMQSRGLRATASLFVFSLSMSVYGFPPLAADEIPFAASAVLLPL